MCIKTYLASATFAAETDSAGNNTGNAKKDHACCYAEGQVVRPPVVSLASIQVVPNIVGQFLCRGVGGWVELDLLL